MFIENTEELAQNKLVLLYLINKSDMALNKNMITEFMLENDYMNYFLVQQYLSELVGSDFLLINKDNFYDITSKGDLALSYFVDRIDEDFRADVKAKFVKTKEAVKKETEVVSEYYMKENGQYVVNLKLVENEDILFSIYLDVANKDQAQDISNNWKENTEEIYIKVLDLFISKKNKE